MEEVAAKPLAAPAGRLESLAGMPAALEQALARVPAAALRTRPSPDDFALVEQACHLRDVDRDAFLVRAQRILAEEVPLLEPFFGDAVARERDYLSQDAAQAAREFASARRELVALLGRATAAQLERTGIFGERRITLGELAGLVLEHDAEHRAQLEALLERFARG